MGCFSELIPNLEFYNIMSLIEILFNFFFKFSVPYIHTKLVNLDIENLNNYHFQLIHRLCGYRC